DDAAVHRRLCLRVGLGLRGRLRPADLRPRDGARGGPPARGHSRRRPRVHPLCRRLRGHARPAARRGGGGARGDGRPDHGLAGGVARPRRRAGVAASPARRARPHGRAAEPLQPGPGAAARRRAHRRRIHAHLLGPRLRARHRRAPADSLAAAAGGADRRPLHAGAAVARSRSRLRRAVVPAARDDRAHLRRARDRSARHAAARPLRWGPRHGPHTPHARSRPGKPGTALDDASRSTTEWGPRHGSHTPSGSSRARLGRRTACGFALPRRPGKPGTALDDASCSTGSERVVISAPALALTSALCSAAATVLISRGLVRYGPYTGAWVNLVVGTTCVWIAVLLGGGVGRPTPAGVAYFALAGLIGTVGGRLLRFISIETVGASISAALINLSPLVASALAIAVLGERVTAPVLVGTLVIVGGTTLLSAGGRGTGVRAVALLLPLMSAV